MTGTHASVAERLYRQCIPEPNSGCWLWTGPLKLGYGMIRTEGHGRMSSAHRVSYEIHVGPIKDGLHVCHKCDVQSCINPGHLFLGTHAENMADMRRKGRARGPRSEDSRTAKLTSEKAREILALRLSGISATSLGKRYGVGRQAILNIWNRSTWRAV